MMRALCPMLLSCRNSPWTSPRNSPRSFPLPGPALSAPHSRPSPSKPTAKENSHLDNCGAWLGYSTRTQVLAFLKQHGVYLRYGLADLEHDRKAGDAIQ